MLATLWETFRNGIQVNQRQRIPESETIALNSTGTTLILTVLRGPQAGTRFTFAAPATFTIGRDVMAEMSLPSDPYLSRFHCLIRLDQSGCRFVDLTSRNSTRLNNRPVSSHTLVDGDVLCLGRSRILTSLEGTWHDHGDHGRPY